MIYGLSCMSQSNQRAWFRQLQKLTAPATAGLGAACFVNYAPVSKSNSSITKADFGRTPDGKPVEIYTLRNSQGAEARIFTYGGVVQSLAMPDKHGRMADIVLGFDNLQDYIEKSPCFGALIGRYGNRIGGAKFTLAGKTYALAANNGPNTLHGGLIGFDKVVWTARSMETRHGPALILTYLSADGEEGFPGNLLVTAIYTLTDGNELKVEFTATTDRPTVVNLTHHSYFNLAGQGHGDVLNHLVHINADQFTPVDSTLIPTGELRPVAGTPFDFRTPTPVGARINDPNNEQIKFAGGYDDNWVLNKPAPTALSLAARVHEPVTGRTLEVWTTSPGMQFYTGNFLDGTIAGKDGKVYQHRCAFCMEPQHFPDSPNHPDFPTTELKPGETCHNVIIYKFGAK
jgi:aldose 1-epimerase